MAQHVQHDFFQGLLQRRRQIFVLLRKRLTFFSNLDALQQRRNDAVNVEFIAAIGKQFVKAAKDVAINDRVAERRKAHHFIFVK